MDVIRPPIDEPLVEGAEIGTGAIASVREVHGAHSGSRFAAKLLHARHERDEAARARFAREAELASGLVHPNIVRVFGVRAIAGRTALLMELVEGPTLAAHLARQGPLSAVSLAGIGRDIARGLAHAHGHGVIHRDLKPANILLTLGPPPSAKIADFGLARAASFASADRRALTVLGTPPYMAPECLDPLAVDPRTDLYALGCILFELATGAPPFAGNTPHAVLQAHRDAPIPQLPASYGPALDAVVRRLLAKAPGERPQSASVVADELEALTTPTTALARTASVSEASEGRCAQCGGDLLPELRVCFRCGAVQVFLEPGPFSVFVVGPGRVSHKFSTELRDRLVRWVHANASAGLDPSNLERGIPRLAFPLLTGLSQASAQTFVTSLHHLGIRAELSHGPASSHHGARQNARALLRRGLTLGAAIFAFPAFIHPFLGLALCIVGVLIGLPIVYAFAARSAFRPALRVGRAPDRASLPPAMQHHLDSVHTTVPALREARHREGLRTVVHRAITLTRPLSSNERAAVDEEMARAIALASTASLRMDALDQEMATAAFDPADPGHRARMHERDLWSARLLQLTAALDALAARRASAEHRQQEATRNDDLAEIRASVEALEEVQSL